MDNINLKVIQADIIPPLQKGTVNSLHSFSEWYYGKIETVSGQECKAIVCYDFKNQKWFARNSGIKKLIEYYI